MRTTDKKRIEDLERRVKELEARPIVITCPPIVITVPMQPQPAPVIEPWYSFKPIWYVDHSALPAYTVSGGSWS